jgi:hypothetical protein
MHRGWQKSGGEAIDLSGTSDEVEFPLRLKELGQPRRLTEVPKVRAASEGDMLAVVDIGS